MKKYALGFVLFLCWTSILFAQEIPMDKQLRYGKLENGLTYYIRQNKYPEKCADFYIAQNVGAILEEDHQNGLAHFLEHMAFNGTKHFPGKGIIDYMERIGAQFGRNINAYTSLDETVYMLRSIPTVRPSIVDSCLLIVHDWSSFISLEDTEIDKERGVILEEWRTGANAGRRMWKESNKQKYIGSQYAKRDVIGDTAVIKHFTYDALRSYYRKWYRPDLQAVIVVGDIDVDQVEAGIKRLFADIPKPLNPAKRVIYSIPENTEPIVSIVTDPEASVAAFGLEYKQTPLSDALKKTEEGYRQMLIQTLIVDMFDDRLDELVRQPESAIAGAQCDYDAITRSCDAFQVYVVAKEGKEKQAFATLLEETQRVKRYGFTAEELKRIKAKTLASYEKAYNERNKQNTKNYMREYANHFLELEPVPGIEWEYPTAKRMLEKEISLEMLNSTVQRYIQPANLIVDIMAPEKKGVELPAREEVLAKLQASYTASVSPYKEKALKKDLMRPSRKTGKIVKETVNSVFGTTEWQLNNGIRVILKPTVFKDDQILLSAFSEGGLSLVPTQKLVSGTYAVGVLQNNGWGSFSTTELDKMLAGKIAGVSPHIGTYSEGFSGNSSVKDFETMLQLLCLKFTAVRKDKAAFSSYLQRMQTSLANADKDPRKAFRDSISMMVNNHHPRTILSTIETLKKISQEEALAIYKQRFANPADFTFVLAGNINPDSVKTLVLRYLGTLKTTKERETWKDNNVRMPNGTVKKSFEREMKVGKASAYILLSGGLPYNLTNKINLNALADILDIRYTETIREEEGGTYGVRVSASVTNRPQEQASLSVLFDTDASKQEYLTSLVYKELESISANGPKPEVLQKVKENLLKQYNEDIQENNWWLSAIQTYEKDGFCLPVDYVKEVNNLSAESIQNTLKALMGQKNTLELVMKPKKD